MKPKNDPTTLVDASWSHWNHPRWSENSGRRFAVSLHRAACEVITAEANSGNLYHPNTRVGSVQWWGGIYGYTNSQFFFTFKVIDFEKAGSLGDKGRLKSHQTGWPSAPNSSDASAEGTVRNKRLNQGTTHLHHPKWMKDAHSARDIDWVPILGWRSQSNELALSRN